VGALRERTTEKATSDAEGVRGAGAGKEMGGAQTETVTQEIGEETEAEEAGAETEAGAVTETKMDKDGEAKKERRLAL